MNKEILAVIEFLEEYKILIKDYEDLNNLLHEYIFENDELKLENLELESQLAELTIKVIELEDSKPKNLIQKMLKEGI